MKFYHLQVGQISYFFKSEQKALEAISEKVLTGIIESSQEINVEIPDAEIEAIKNAIISKESYGKELVQHSIDLDITFVDDSQEFLDLTFYFYDKVRLLIKLSFEVFED